MHCNINAMHSLLTTGRFRAAHVEPPERHRLAWHHVRWVSTSRNTRMAWRELGNPGGPVWLVLHGGPGSGAQPGQVAPLDLAQHRVIVPDQRGAGLSRPRGRTAGNTCEALVADLECLRKQLGVERWAVLAGSWGTVLALRYAQQHPTRVDRLVLRAAFALRASEIQGLLQPHPRRDRAVWCCAQWPRLPRQQLPTVLRRLYQLFHFGAATVAGLRALRCWRLLEQRSALRGLRRSALHAAHAGAPAGAARAAWAQAARQLREGVAGLRRDGIQPQDRRDSQRLRIQVHYLRHGGFVPAGGLDAAVRSLSINGIASDWVHGRFDAVCPPANTRRWVAQIEVHAPALARAHWSASGHLAGEPAMRAALARVVGTPPADEARR